MPASAAPPPPSPPGPAAAPGPGSRGFGSPLGSARASSGASRVPPACRRGRRAGRPAGGRDRHDCRDGQRDEHEAAERRGGERIRPAVAGRRDRAHPLAQRVRSSRGRARLSSGEVSGGHRSSSLEFLQGAAQPSRDGRRADTEHARGLPRRRARARRAARSPHARRRQARERLLECGRQALDEASSCDSGSATACSRAAGAPRRGTSRARSCGDREQPVARCRARGSKLGQSRSAFSNVSLERSSASVALRQVEQVAVDVVEMPLRGVARSRRRRRRAGGSGASSVTACTPDLRRRRSSVTYGSPFLARDTCHEPRSSLRTARLSVACEQLLPAREQRLQLVAGGAVRRERVHVGPVRGERVLERAMCRSSSPIRRLDPLELGRLRRSRATGFAGFGSSVRLPRAARSAAASHRPRSRARTRSAQPPS